MKKGRILWLILGFLMALSLVLTSCAKEVEEEEEEKGPPPTEEEEVVEEEEEEGGPPITGDWWDKFGEPEYGGTITYRVRSLAVELNPYINWSGQYDYYGEYLWSWDWTLDREIWDFSTMFSPDQYWVGNLVESWEMPDMQTIIAHIRQGVHWQDKPPLNGREFTADDIQHHFDKILGTGSGYTEPTPLYAGRVVLWKKVTATDKYTVVFDFTYPTAQGFLSVVELAGQCSIPAPEVAKMPGGITDWNYAVGTGPWILTDFVLGSSVAYNRNPNYWGYDQRHPENQLPYADKLKVLCIPDVATATAALRSGKVDMVTELSWEQAASLKRTNPDLQQAKLPTMSPAVGLRVDHEPFTDIRVRKALQMALDRRTIAETHYGGTVEGIPCGVITPAHKGYNYPYEEWPQELKDDYSYNPERARELLAEAGYPAGFKTNIVASATSDLDLTQIIQGYFKDIGVEMEIKVMEAVSLMALQRTRKIEQMLSWSCSRTFAPQMNIAAFTSTDMANYINIQDPAYDAIYQKFLTSADLEESKQLVNDSVKYALEKHWIVNIFPIYTYNIWQPYLKGYTNEFLARGSGWVWARLWIDQDLKESIGR